MFLTVTYITSREEPHFEWFFDSLSRQRTSEDNIEVIVVDLRIDESGRRESVQEASRGRFDFLKHVEPMPNVWQGRHRITKCDTWAIATAKNTGLCLATTDWIAFCDDRSVLSPTWLEAVRDAGRGRYVVAGSYKKVHDLVVEGGIVRSFTEPADGTDFRIRHGIPSSPRTISGSQVFGCTQALPVEWMLEVNGFDETCNTVGLEDCMFGHMLQNRNKPIKFDYRMLLIEDRTPGKLGSHPRRKDKGRSPNDKSHGIVRRLSGQTSAVHDRDLRKIKSVVQSGSEWPVPSGPTTDWWDGEPLAEMDWP